MPRRELLAAYNTIDVALDPFPYSGGVTTCEALWMGVPVVTCPGETFASRHSLSHLSNVGLTETIATDRREYVERAVRLAQDLPHLAACAGCATRWRARRSATASALRHNLMAVLRERVAAVVPRLADRLLDQLHDLDRSHGGWHLVGFAKLTVDLALGHDEEVFEDEGERDRRGQGGELDRRGDRGLRPARRKAAMPGKGLRARIVMASPYSPVGLMPIDRAGQHGTSQAMKMKRASRTMPAARDAEREVLVREADVGDRQDGDDDRPRHHRLPRLEPGRVVEQCLGDRGLPWLSQKRWYDSMIDGWPADDVDDGAGADQDQRGEGEQGDLVTSRVRPGTRPPPALTRSARRTPLRYSPEPGVIVTDRTIAASDRT